MAGPSRKVPGTGTLDPPRAAAAVANSSPVNARTFFLRNIEEIIPNNIAPTIRL